MDDLHLKALLEAARATQEEGWSVVAEDRTMTLHAAKDGVGLNITKVVRLRESAGLFYAENFQGELFVLAKADIFAGSVEGGKAQGRKAGFRA